VNNKHILIELENLYEGNLKQKLWDIELEDDSNDTIIRAIRKLINVSIIGENLSQKSLWVNADTDIIQENITILEQINNIEIIARLNDYLSTRKINKFEHKINAVDAYKTMFNLTKKDHFLVRIFNLIGFYKDAFKKEITDLSGRYINDIINCPHLYWQKELIRSSSWIDQESKSKILVPSIYQLLKTFKEQKDYDKILTISESLYLLGEYSKNECRIKKAIAYEERADLQISKKKPDTFYPKISFDYEKALKLVKDLPHCVCLINRLENKIIAAKSDLDRIIQKFGINTLSKVDERKIYDELTISGVKDFKSGLKRLGSISLTFVNAPISDKYYGKFFSKTGRTRNGLKIGELGVNESLIYDNNLNSFIIKLRIIKQIMDTDGEKGKDSLKKIINANTSRFVPKDREELILAGLYAGFNNDFSTASHLLIPQLENSFKYILEQNNTIYVKVGEDIQYDNTLGGVLSKMNENVINNELYNELNRFLIDGNYVNFRNNLCHGLINKFQIEYYGIYLWQLCLRFIINTDEYFEFSIN